ncbi:MAG: biotin/lipoyl-binding protein [Candidatus Bipolaricaulota bacterium]|nr:biotin/lipoyl-binding protein [Candidatus Bipolaricaulota bacterium]MDW8030909.1 biotin/lipoyl-containing protein [Candidatus Bipolaricaulota bacterium]
MAHEIVEAPLAGKILQIHVRVGDRVAEGDTLCTLEALKMENAIVAPISGTVKEIRISPGQAIKAGEPMIVIES